MHTSINLNKLNFKESVGGPSVHNATLILRRKKSPKCDEK